MFADLDESLKQMLIQEVPLPQNDVDVVFERPDRDNVARFSKPTVDLFLFDVSENRDLREAGWRPAGTENGRTTLRWPPLQLDVHYLVTVWAQAVDDEHRLIYHLHRTLRRLSEMPDELREGAVANQPGPVNLEVDDQELKTLVDIWGVIDNRMQPGFVLKATVAVDLNGAREVPVVRTSTLRAGPSGAPLETSNRIAGRVTAEGGEPIAGAKVRVGGHLAVTDNEGRFTVAPLPNGELQIEVDAAGHREVAQRVAVPGSYDVTLAVADAAPPDGDRARTRPRRR